MRKAFVRFYCALVLVMLVMSACTPVIKTEEQLPALNRYEGSFIDVFDTVTKVIVYDTDETSAKAHIQQIHDELLTCHKLYDIYNAYDGIQNLYTINQNAGVGPVSVDARILDLIEYAEKAYTLTSGRMNIAMGSVLSIWHRYREEGIDDPEHASLPPMKDLKQAADHMDPSKIVIDRQAGTVYLADPQMQLDVGAIAKGYAAQLVTDDMRAKGVVSMLLSVGGNVCSIGKRADGKDWKVGIQSPEDPAANLCYVGVEDQCLVTSGTYQRYYTVAGTRYHHIIDPSTLMPSTRYSSVSVLSDDSALADALSTALFNMSLEEGMDLVASQKNVEAMWVEQNGTQHFSEGFEAYLLS